MGKKTNKELLVDYLISSGINDSWKNIGYKFNFEGEQARRIWLRYRQNHGMVKSQTETLVHKGHSIYEEDIQKGTAQGTYYFTNQIHSLNDLSKMIDTNKWEITKYTQSFSGNEDNPKWQVKAWMKLKKEDELQILSKVLNNYKPNYKPLTEKDIKINISFNEPSMLLINLADPHFDKQDLDGSTIQEKSKKYLECLSNLLMRAYHSHNLDKIVFVIGNDTFNTDNFHNSTTNLTPQNVNTSWDNAYEIVFDTMVSAISLLKQFTNDLVVMLVQGNHDRTKSYYLAHGLEAFFKGEKNILFERKSTNRKVITYGENFLGFHHGDCKNERLPLVFASEFYKDWGKCKYKEIILADKHHNNEKTFKQSQNEAQGIRMRILPSLSGTDKWHDENLYFSRQAGIALVYDKELGKISEFEYAI